MATIDFRREVSGLDGNVMVLDGEPLTLARAATIALLGTTDKHNGQDKYKRWTLCQKIHQATGPIELKAEDVSLCKTSVGEVFVSAGVVGPVWDLLEGE